jgi:putative porin
MRNKTAVVFCLALMLPFPLFFAAPVIAAKQSASDNLKDSSASHTDSKKGSGAGRDEATPSGAGTEERLKALEQLIERQQREIQALREIIEKKPAEPAERRAAETSPRDAETSPRDGARPIADASQQPASGKNEAAQPEMQKKVEELFKRFGSMRLSGDIRFRVEPFLNQGFDSPTSTSPRNRLRVRARLALDGALGKNFDWGFRLASGLFTDPISTNQTLTDFFERKPFALERAFIKYDSKTDDVGVQLIAGKFEPTFRRTQMVWDDDVNVEGASEALYFKSGSALKQVKLVAFQLPFDEQAAGKDAVLYGGQVQTDWQMSKTISANVNLGFYDWVRADRVAQALGVPFFQVNGGITNGSGVTGNQNGSLGTTNRIIRNGSGQVIGFVANFHLLDILGNLTWQASSRYPVTVTFDYVRNLSSRIDDEQNGYWAAIQVGQTREKGDYSFGYTFTRIEQDAVLVPFNFSDMLASNSRVHLPRVSYQIANGVTFQWLGLLSQRANKVVPTSPFNRVLARMQFDVIYTF